MFMDFSSFELLKGGREANEMLDSIPYNVMYCDLNFEIRYINKRSYETLKKLENLIGSIGYFIHHYNTNIRQSLILS